ncbi:MAG: hypothetical protein ABEJ70_02655, partial [Halobacteriaceae archaeon]
GSGGRTTTSLPALPDSVGRTVRPVDVDAVPDRYDTAATVEVVEPRVTTEHTARLRVTVRNTGEERRAYVFDPDPPMHHEPSATGPGTLVLLAADGRHERAGADCWRPSGGVVGDGGETVTLAPGEAVQNTLGVWDAGTGACLPPGAYAFRRQYPQFDDRHVENTWSFTLHLARP